MNVYLHFHYLLYYVTRLARIAKPLKKPEQITKLLISHNLIEFEDKS